VVVLSSLKVTATDVAVVQADVLEVDVEVVVVVGVEVDVDFEVVAAACELVDPDVDVSCERIVRLACANL
jgi:anaerobic glycerol-3-phosphate dehydrogenase